MLPWENHIIIKISSSSVDVSILLILWTKTGWYSINNFFLCTSRTYSSTFLISWVSCFLCSHPWRINPMFFFFLLDFWQVVWDLTLLWILACHRWIASLWYNWANLSSVEKCYLCGRRSSIQNKEMLLLFKMNGGWQTHSHLKVASQLSVEW